jgi:methyl-accepting chemotaxis protein
MSPFVEHGSQLYLSLLLLLYLLVYTLVLLVIMLAPSVVKFTSSSLSLERQLDAAREFLFIDQRVVPALLAVIVAIAVHFLLLTRQIFGPLKRLGGMFRTMEGGSWPPPFVRRRRDFHAGLFTSFNAALESVGDDLRRARELVASSRAKLSAAAGGTELREAEEECRKAIDLLSRYLPDAEEKSGE